MADKVIPTKDLDPIARKLREEERKALISELRRGESKGYEPPLIGRWLGHERKSTVGYSGAAPYANQETVAQYGADQSYGMPWAAHAQGVTGRANLSKAKPAKDYLWPMDRATPYKMDYGEMVDATKDRRAPAPKPGMPPLPDQNPYHGGMSEDDKQNYDKMVEQGLYNTNRSALASLGARDFSRFVIDPRKESRMTAAGVYISHLNPETGLPDTPKNSTQSYDRAWVNRAGEEERKEGAEKGLEYGSTISHEATHRGTELLRQHPKTMLAANALMRSGGNEEPIVRTIGASLVGTKHTDWDAKYGGDQNEELRETIIRAHENPKSVGLYKKHGTGWRWEHKWGLPKHAREAALEFLAAELIKDKSPGGPR